MHNPPVFDEQRILDFVDGDIEFLQMLVSLFVSTSPTQVAEIAAAVAASDADALNRAAHQLKGSVANFGADGAIAAAFALEAMGRSGDLAGSEAAHVTLVEEIDRLATALQAFAAKHS